MTLSEEDLAAAVAEHANGATIRLRVVPRAPQTRWAGRHGDAVRIKVHAPPVEGAANEAVLRFVAAEAGVPTREVHLLSGERSRTKVVLVRGRTAAELRRALTAQPPHH